MAYFRDSDRRNAHFYPKPACKNNQYDIGTDLRTGVRTKRSLLIGYRSAENRNQTGACMNKFTHPIEFFDYLFEIGGDSDRQSGIPKETGKANPVFNLSNTGTGKDQSSYSQAKIKQK